ncbi:MAG: hypothetical protein A2722_02450 [Candidatus Doudnabacteria bacterium RIFCSPHIGHO2_01_FULL_50_11]|uniref:histidine kinase n=1 Tax=Candidatus Doudnabacteria bacterium RIFCSPHIGHO2_01_FULL_50_11 TaxID=1817828 RepID=A0A1F5PFK9_9BACT|nr:MAG: hypothetical protein A2722_02450 [Candidatus Doudnabacteria bacterium RIFCSPHIGHO2_01_FULL_50_11]HLC44998.1 HAMP domain-containing sensor histidine kinase [Patescibacteria group bacterium]
MLGFKSKTKKGSSLEESLKTDFITLSSHQLRTPLSAVKWFTEIMMTQRNGKLNQKQLEYLREIYRSNERAIALVNDLLQVSRVQEGKLHLDLTDVDLKSLVDEIIDSHRSQLTANTISYNFQVINGPLPKLALDKVKIRRVFQNLLNNAIQYTPRGGSVQITLKNSPREIVCSITDTGVGIPADQQSKIFDRFYRGTNVSKIQPDGTGLGLYIAKSLIEAHRGKIWFESTEGEGATFYFSLPKSGK